MTIRANANEYKTFVLPEDRGVHVAVSDRWCKVGLSSSTIVAPTEFFGLDHTGRFHVPAGTAGVLWFISDSPFTVETREGIQVLLNSRLPANFAVRPEGSSSGETHVFALIGQSNMQGSDVNQDGAVWPENVRQWHALTRELVAPVGNLNHPAGHEETWTSLALTFAQNYLAANPGVKLVFAPGAVGGSGFDSRLTYKWNQGDTEYQNFIGDINALFSENAGFKLKGILWQNGEADAQLDSTSAGAYEAALDQMIGDMRADISAASSSTPFVVGGLIDGLTGASAGDRDTVHHALEYLPYRIPYTAFAQSTGLTSAGRDSSFSTPDDGVHFDYTSLRTLGTRHFFALQEARGRSEVLLRPNLLQNGAMDDVSAQVPDVWTLTHGATISGGKGRVVADKAWFEQDVTVTPGKTYRATWTISDYAAGNSAFYLLGGTDVLGSGQVGNGVKTTELVAETGNTTFRINVGGGSTMNIDDLRLEEL